LWTREDRDWHIAYMQERDERCPGCGQPFAECMNHDTAGRWEVLRDTCEPCRVLEAEQENDAELKSRPRGRKYATKLN
jgi:hypothetical protein